MSFRDAILCLAYLATSEDSLSPSEHDINFDVYLA
jgi:hypothetical protein